MNKIDAGVAIHELHYLELNKIENGFEVIVSYSISTNFFGDNKLSNINERYEFKGTHSKAKAMRKLSDVLKELEENE